MTINKKLLTALALISFAPITTTTIGAATNDLASFKEIPDDIKKEIIYTAINQTNSAKEALDLTLNLMLTNKDMLRFINENPKFFIPIMEKLINQAQNIEAALTTLEIIGKNKKEVEKIIIEKAPILLTNKFINNAFQFTEFITQHLNANDLSPLVLAISKFALENIRLDYHLLNGLVRAATTGNPDFLALIFSQDKLPDILKHWTTALNLAIRLNDIDTVKMLLEKKRLDANYDSFLTNAIRSPEPNSKIVELLLENGANINHFNAAGQTPLMLATMIPNPQIVKLLLEHGADHTLKNNHDQTALDIAKEMDNINNIAQQNRNYLLGAADIDATKEIVAMLAKASSNKN